MSDRFAGVCKTVFESASADGTRVTVDETSDGSVALYVEGEGEELRVNVKARTSGASSVNTVRNDEIGCVRRIGGEVHSVIEISDHRMNAGAKEAVFLAGKRW